MAGEGIDQYK
ncbi:hypothetical protein YPPY46_2978, partial [Yersinia pestis PY-46]